MSVIFFTFEIFPFILICVAFICNLFVFVIFSRKKLRTVPSKNLLKYLAAIDLLCTLCSLNRVFESRFMNYSNFTCKLISFCYYAFPSISSWLLGFISAEKLLIIKKPHYKIISDKNVYQLGICFGIIALNVLFNSQIFTLDDIYKDLNATNIKNIYSDKCDIAFSGQYVIYGNLYFITASILPFTLMFACSICLVVFIFNSRRRAFNTCAIKNKRIIKKDIQFALQILFLDILFLILTTPLSVSRLFKLYNSNFLLGYFSRIIYFVRFFLNFFIYLIFNSIFRNEFFSIIRFKF